MEDRIKMVAVLALINEYADGGEPRVFSIGYSKTDGKKGFKKSVRKAGGIYKKVEAAEKSTFGYNLKENNVLLLHNLETDKPFSIKIHLLTHFNGIRIQH
ncbi:hypothetical protein [Pontibacter mangrovi]|uniref:Uncharacterized protein n=1 Tax=Pontibacter mangrovi TaxID=2589816 RepID=A0A501W1X6_9BACT|nr:hypothetical protein [Pontibacter mangrovi]TPE43983.1 hypothetical protein FJM65_11195 [Pontibacter mangrovi]